MIRGWVMAEVGRLCKEISAKTTITSDEEMIFCVKSIFEDHPTLKVEEIRACFDMVRKGKFGKLYERLKTPEILDFLRRYEGEIRVEILERVVHDTQHEKKQETAKRIGESSLREIIEDIEPTEYEPVKGHGVGSRLRKHFNS
jgi:hypothetical protein